VAKVKEVYKNMRYKRVTKAKVNWLNPLQINYNVVTGVLIKASVLRLMAYYDL